MTTATPPTPPPQTPPLIPSLPDDVALNCIARIPRSHHPILSIVSKPIRALISSPLLFSARSILSSAEHFLYVAVRVPTKPSLQWFTLHQALQNPSKYLLVPVPSLPSPSPIGAAFAAVGPRIYALGGSVSDVPSSHVWTLDCRFNTWEPAPSMRVGREFAAAGVVGGKIYVIGGCVVDTWARSKNWAEVFDPRIGRWESVPSPVEIREKWMHASAVVQGKVYAMADRNGVVYEPESESWDVVESELDLGWRGRACVVDGVLYCYDFLGKIRGYDMKMRLWRELRGVEKGLPCFLCGATMANLGGKLVVLWEGKGGGSSEIEIWCAEVEVEKSEDGELLGTIEWSDVVLKVPKGSSIVHCLGVTL